MVSTFFKCAYVRN